MDPSTRIALIEQARVAGLFDTDFMPEEDLDSIELVETAAGNLLILTAVEAATYADAQVKARKNANGAPELNGVECIFGERVMVALERLGRLRARTLERLGDDVDPSELRIRILGLLAAALDEPAAGDERRIERYARAWRDLKPDSVLLGGTPLPVATNVVNVAGGLSELEARRLAGHVYQTVQTIEYGTELGLAEVAEVARTAVLEGLEELRTEAGQ